jgi:hypothetical protein
MIGFLERRSGVMDDICVGGIGLHSSVSMLLPCAVEEREHLRSDCTRSTSNEQALGAVI